MHVAGAMMQQESMNAAADGVACLLMRSRSKHKMAETGGINLALGTPMRLLLVTLFLNLFAETEMERDQSRAEHGAIHDNIILVERAHRRSGFTLGTN